MVGCIDFEYLKVVGLCFGWVGEIGGSYRFIGKCS